MALQYWEKLIHKAHFRATGRRDFYNQTFVHEFVLDRKWTTAAIQKYCYEASGNNVVLTHDGAKKAVSIFHDYINNQKITAPGTDKDWKKEARYAKVGGKRTRPGWVLHTGDDVLITNPGTTGLGIMQEARKRAQREIDNYLTKVGAPLNQIKNKQGKEVGLGAFLQFAHGEGGAVTDKKTTVSNVSLGQETLDAMNAEITQIDLLDKGIKNVELIQQTSVKALKDMMQMDLGIAIDIDPKEVGDKVQFHDEFIFSGGMKIQDPYFARKYDMDFKNFEKGGIGHQYYKAIQKELNNLLGQGRITKGEYQSSPKGKDRMKAAGTLQTTKAFSKELNKKDFNVVGDIALAKFSKQEQKNFKSKKKKGRTHTTKGRKAKRRSQAQDKARANSQANPIALKELIQAALPEEVLERMNFPALVNRTGRFRKSATITNVMVGPRGATEIEYTYMKNPYQTFEPGGKQGGTYRDPRKIIGESIREIATKLTGNKFIRTRRV